MLLSSSIRIVIIISITFANVIIQQIKEETSLNESNQSELIHKWNIWTALQLIKVQLNISGQLAWKQRPGKLIGSPTANDTLFRQSVISKRTNLNGFRLRKRKFSSINSTVPVTAKGVCVTLLVVKPLNWTWRPDKLFWQWKWNIIQMPGQSLLHIKQVTKCSAVQHGCREVCTIVNGREN